MPTTDAAYYLEQLTPERDAGGDLICPECDQDWTQYDRHHPDYDPSPMHQWEVTEGWAPEHTETRTQHNPEGL